MRHYYNENDPKAAAWLKELIHRELIPAGDVDTRSITDVKPDDLTPYTQCHFFAGIGGWPRALSIAGWPAARPVWTGSCPCQPFSDAGLQLAELDERHLWPVWFNLIRQCRPPVVLGEQVASKVALGWLDGVFTDLEGAGYRGGAADLCAAGVGAPHIRQRLYWVADTHQNGQRGQCSSRLHEDGQPRDDSAGRGAARGLDDTFQSRLEGHAGDGDHWHQSGRLDAHTTGSTASTGSNSGLPDTGSHLGGRGQHKQERRTEGRTVDRRTNAWTDYALISCADGKTRRIEPGLAPLAHGVPARVVRLRGYGNAIVPEQAAEFVSAYLNVTEP